MLDQREIAAIDEAGHEEFRQFQGLIDLAEQQRAGVRGRRSTIEAGVAAIVCRSDFSGASGRVFGNGFHCNRSKLRARSKSDAFS
ncbi:hypothetical protein [Methylosinus sp. LW4]|uniref:hypothetical protein n=1 Tax=Methylosinus sp. LW4 TaxID=136993 RepID=UPI00039B21CA|nr:hypothetical protein [Methylosinus sp. LW4]